MNDAPCVIDPETGFVSGIACLCSPHCDDRPVAGEISLLVVHAISLPPGEFGTSAIHDLFLGCLDPTAHPYFRDISMAKVSTHFLIDRLGKLTQFVPVTRRAWHAGASYFEGRDKVNDFSVGIELVGSDESAFTDAQYDRLVSLTKALQSAWPAIDSSRIVGHSDISPGRKTDPGPRFDWARYQRLLAT